MVKADRQNSVAWLSSIIQRFYAGSQGAQAYLSQQLARCGIIPLTCHQFITVNELTIKHKGTGKMYYLCEMLRLMTSTRGIFSVLVFTNYSCLNWFWHSCIVKHWPMSLLKIQYNQTHWVLVTYQILTVYSSTAIYDWVCFVRRCNQRAVWWMWECCVIFWFGRIDVAMLYWVSVQTIQ